MSSFKKIFYNKETTRYTIYFMNNNNVNVINDVYIGKSIISFFVPVPVSDESDESSSDDESVAPVAPPPSTKTR
jgi:hypothetical protein